MTENVVTRCGLVAVIGAPNAGKSTLINRLVGEKVTIVSQKVQTTRTRVRGIMMHNSSQVVLIDTPGIFEARRRLDRAMVSAAWDGQQDGDITALIVDASRRDPVDDLDRIVERISRSGDGKKVILVLNKIDRIEKTKLLPLTAAFNEKFDFAATFMISAESGSGVSDLARWLSENVPTGPYIFPEDQLSDMPQRLMAAEVTREKVFHFLHDELPYAMTVETESWEQGDDGSIKISQIVYVMRDAHKPIVLGKGGAQIKRIGQHARTDLEEMFGCRIHLNLLVRVEEGWMDDPERYAIWGLDHKA